MKIGLRSGIVLGLLWVGTCIAVFSLGRDRGDRDGTQSPHVGVKPEAAKIGSAILPGASQSTTQQLTALHRSGSVGRFMSYTRRLGAEQLERLLPEITESMTAEEVEHALRRLMKEIKPGPARRLARRELIHRWGQLDARAAFAHVDGLSEAEEELRTELKITALEGWASADPKAAHDWAQSAGELQELALRAVWRGIADSNDLRKTLEYIPTLGPGDNKYSEPYEKWDIYMTLHPLYAQDPDTVVKWVEDLPAGEVRSRSFHSIVDRWARHDPRAALAWVDEQADNSNRTEAYVEVAESWARHDPEAAVEWAASLPADTPELKRIYERMFTRFLQYDYEDAANYLVAQEPSPTLDTAFEVYIDKVKSIDPGASMVWATEITDEARRWEAMKGVAGAWRGKDEAALQRYVEGAELTQVQRNELLGK